MQLDSKPRLDQALLCEICQIMTRFELIYQEYPSLEFINKEIIEALDAIRNLVLPRSDGLP